MGSLHWLADVVLNPNPSSLPGAAMLQALVNGVASWALIGALAALLVGAVSWALGSHSHNVHQSMAGRRAVLVAGAAALLIGAAPHLINFVFHAGGKVH
jgi:hypothetical protein